MKRCPECRRDYYDDSLLYCLDDGTALLEGPASGSGHDGSQTAILHETAPPREAQTRAHIYATGETSVLPSTEYPKSKSFDRRWLLVPLGLAIVVFASWLGYRYVWSAGSGTINSIAVLPFENKNSDPDTDYLSDGLAESVIFRLTQLPELKVSPASSVMRYRGKEVDFAKVASDLGVDAVMTGRLVKRGDNLSITVELVDARKNKSLWGEQYERKMSDLLATQREIATTVAEKLQPKFTGNEQGLSKKYTNSNDAYQLYLKGRYLWNQRTKTSVRQSSEFFKQAIEKDPSFALAYSGLAEAYVLFANYEVMPPADCMPLAKAAAKQALDLDDSIAAAHNVYGFYFGFYEFDSAAGEREFKRAIELDPKYATAHQWLASLYGRLLRFDEAQAEISRAKELDPLSPIISTNFGLLDYNRRHYDDAIAELNQTLELQPDFPVALNGVCWVYNAKRDYPAAVSACRKAINTGLSQFNNGNLVLSLARAGQKDEARRLLEEMKAASQKEYVPASAFALAYLGLDQKDEALRWLEKDFEDRGYWIGGIAEWPQMDELRSEPRFKALLNKMHLPETQ